MAAGNARRAPGFWCDQAAGLFWRGPRLCGIPSCILLQWPLLHSEMLHVCESPMLHREEALETLQARKG